MQAVLIFMVFVTAHVLADFVVQRDVVISGKRNGIWQAYAEHAAAHWVLMLLMLLVFAPTYAREWTAWWLLPLLAISHAAIDWVKENTGSDGGAWSGPRAFVLDQCAHLLVLLSGALILTQTPGLLLWQWWLQHNVLLATLLLAYLLALPACGYFNRVLLQPLAEQLADPLMTTDDGVPSDLSLSQPASTASSEQQFAVQTQHTTSLDLPSAGRYIGWLERFLLLTAVLLQAATAVGLVLAAKSVFRFGDIRRDRQAAEYFLIGTLVSVSEAVIIGLLVHWLLRSAQIW